MKVVFLIFVTLWVKTAHGDLANPFGTYRGTFVLYDKNEDEMIRINDKWAETRFSPCSTFKIPNTVFGLESGKIKNQNFKLHFRNIKNPNKKWPKNWKKDHDLSSAIRNSVVWYYQEIARRIGAKQMKTFLKKADFGNQDISGGIDRFWLSSSLKISPEEQVEFLNKLFSYKLGFSKKNVDLLKKMIVIESSKSYTLRGKTGTCFKKGGVLGSWLVGSLEKRGKTFYYATYMESQSGDYRTLSQNRLKFTKELLKDFGAL